MFMILSSRMLVNLATLFRFFGKFSVELEMTNPPCWYRAWRTIPTNNSSMLWFSTTDVSTYLHLNLSASFLASEIKKNTNVRLVKIKKDKTQQGRHWSVTRTAFFHTHLFRKQPSFWRGPLCWPRETRVYQSEGPGGWFEASLRRSCRTGCRWPKRQPALCQLQTVTLEAVKGKKSIQCLWTSTITRWQRC